MIIVDFSGICLSSIIVNRELDEGLVRHMTLNTLRMYYSKYKEDYGEMILACDGMYNWRRNYFPQYKANRKKGREEDGKDWDSIFGVLNQITEEIREFLPYKVVETYGAEADDVIAIVCKHYQSEQILIVSGDKDFIQLQKYDNVNQYSPITKKHVNGIDPVVYIKEHILKGDKSDGIPNVLSPDHTFTDELRQRPLTSKKINSIMAQDFDDLNDELKRNYQRNDALINLDNIPEELEQSILDDFKGATCGDRSKLLDYFMDKRLKTLTEQIGEF